MDFCRLLRTREKRPNYRRATDKCEEPAPSQLTRPGRFLCPTISGRNEPVRKNWRTEQTRFEFVRSKRNGGRHAPRPVRWQKQTCVPERSSELAHHLSPGKALFDHLISPQQKRFGNRKPQRLRRLEIDQQFEACGPLHGELGRISSLENFVDIHR